MAIAVEESTDRSNIAQRLVYVRYFLNGVSEDILCLIPLKGTMTAMDICSAFLPFGQENELTWNNLV